MGIRRISPGPLALGKARPNRKTTPRSYSFRILMALIKKNTAMTIMKRKEPEINWNMTASFY
jgi:hypothetical protein